MKSELEQLVAEVISGERDIAELVPLLADHILYVPVVTISTERARRTSSSSQDSEANSAQLQSSKITVATFSSNGRRIVPVFSDETIFLEWSDDKHQCFSVAGGDLALTLPEDTWIVLDPGTREELELTPQYVQILSEYEAPAALLSESIVQESESLDTTVKDFEPHSDTSHQSLPARPKARIYERDDVHPTIETALAPEDSHNDSHEDAFKSIADETITPEIDAREASSEDSLTKVIDWQPIEQGLSRVLEDFQEVSEGYIQASDEPYTAAVLGLLTTDTIDAERRFLLIDNIASLSRKFFSTAGAIEVYDDLGLPSSSTWELFQAISPFYVRNADEERSRSTLTIERQRIPSGSSTYDYQGSNEATGAGPGILGWRNLRRKSQKLFGALRQKEQ